MRPTPSSPLPTHSKAHVVHRAPSGWGWETYRSTSDQLLVDYGIYTQAINYPTVPVGTERLRITPGPLHTPAMVEHLVSSLSSVWDRNAVRSRQKSARARSHGRDRQLTLTVARPFCRVSVQLPRVYGPVLTEVKPRATVGHAGHVGRVGHVGPDVAHGREAMPLPAAAA